MPLKWISSTDQVMIGAIVTGFDRVNSPEGEKVNAKELREILQNPQGVSFVILGSNSQIQAYVASVPTKDLPPRYFKADPKLERSSTLLYLDSLVIGKGYNDDQGATYGLLVSTLKEHARGRKFRAIALHVDPPTSEIFQARYEATYVRSLAWTGGDVVDYIEIPLLEGGAVASPTSPRPGKQASAYAAASSST